MMGVGVEGGGRKEMVLEVKVKLTMMMDTTVAIRCGCISRPQRTD